MAIVDQDTAVTDLQEHLPALESMIHSAWEDVLSLAPASLVVMSARSRASLMHDHILAHASQYADSNPSAHYFIRRQMHGLVLNGRYAVRFKKFDEDNRSRNHPTNQVIDFRSQTELEGIDAAHHLEIGYITNELESEVVDVRLACPAGQGNSWVFSVSGKQANSVMEDLFSANNDNNVEDIEPADIEPRQQPGIVVPFARKSE